MRPPSHGGLTIRSVPTGNLAGRAAPPPSQEISRPAGGDRPGRSPALHGGRRARRIRPGSRLLGPAGGRRAKACIGCRSISRPEQRHRRRTPRPILSSPQNEKVVSCHSLHVEWSSNVQSRNEFEYPRPSTPSAPPWHSWGRHSSAHSKERTSPPQDLGSGHVVVCHTTGRRREIADRVRIAGERDREHGRRRGATASVLGETISSTFSPCAGS